MSVTYSECVFVALVIQHASACAILYCHLWPVLLYQFLTLSHKWHYLKNKAIVIKCVLDFLYKF